MIYISSSCLKVDKIKDSIILLAKNGFRNIELSGGTNYYDSFESDLISLKKQYKLNYIIHNYFPPSKKHFVLNLASLNKDIYLKSLEHYKKAIELSKKLESKIFAIHAGFFIDLKAEHLGHKIPLLQLNDKNKTIKQFCNGYSLLKDYSKNTKIYIENNILSYFNYKTYGTNPLMLTCYKDYLDLIKKLKFPLLLDIGHLKVSSNTLGLDFEEELNNLLSNSNYIHISDNDGKSDLHNPLLKKNKLYQILKKFNFSNKIITLEIRADIDKIKTSYNNLRGLLC